MPDLRVITDVRKTVLPFAQIASAEIKVLGRLPHGTISGNSTIAIYAELREPIFNAKGEQIKFVFCETTLALFQMADAAFRGAEEHDKRGGAN